MNKLASLRAAFLAAPLKIKDKDLLTFAEKGRVRSKRGEAEANKAFEMAYTAHLILTDYTGAPQDVLFVAAQWLNANCPDAEDEAIRFHVDVIDHKKVDLSLAVDIAEIVATPDAGDGKVSLQPVPDPATGAFDMATFHPTLA